MAQSDKDASDVREGFFQAIGAGVVAALATLAWGLAQMSFWSIPAAGLAFLVFWRIVELVSNSSHAASMRAWLRQKSGVQILEPPLQHSLPVESKPPVFQGPTPAEHLCTLWLFKREYEAFEKQTKRAENVVEKIKVRFEEAMSAALTDEGARALDNDLYDFMEALQTSDAIFRNCFRIESNMSLTSPYIRSHHPIEGMDRLPNDQNEV